MNKVEEVVMTVVTDSGEIDSLTAMQPLHEFIDEVKKDLEKVDHLFSTVIVTQNKHFPVKRVVRVTFTTADSIYCLQRIGNENFEKRLVL